MKNPTILTLCILWASLSLSFSTTAQNEAKEEPLGTPARYLFPDDYMADPSVHIFEGKVYIYPSHDMYFLPKNRKKGKLPTTALFFLSNRFRGQAGNFGLAMSLVKTVNIICIFRPKTKTTSSASV